MKLLEKSKIVAYVFYVFAALFLIYTVFSIISTIQYLNSVVASGMYVTITASDMISAFVGQVGPYCFYTLVLFAAGYMIHVVGDYLKAQVGEKTVVASVPVEETVETASDNKEEDEAADSDEDVDDDAVEEEIEAELAEAILEDDPDQVVITAELEEVPVEEEEE